MKRMIIALVVLGGLVGAYAWVTTRPEKGAPKLRFTPMARVEPAKVQKIEITQVGDKQKTVLVREDGEKFRVAEPVDYPADKGAVKSLLEKLEKMQFGDTVTDRPDKHAEFEVTDEKGVRVAVWHKDKPEKPRADFYVGKVAEGYTMIRPAAGNQVVQVVGAIKSVFGRDLKGWRDKTILDFKRDEVERIRVSGPSGRFELRAEPAPEPEKKEGAEPKAKGKVAWKIESSPVPVDSLDDDVPQGIVTALYGLKASDFADGVKLEDAGLLAPAWTICVDVRGGAAHVLLVGGRHGDKGDEWYVKTPEKPQVFVIKKYTFERIARKPIDLRDKTITSFKTEDVEEVEIVKDGAKLAAKKADGAWTAPAVKSLDTSKLASAVGAIAGLKAASFSETRDPAKTGLSRPKGAVTVTLADRSRVTLRVGAETEDNAYYVARDGRPDVFLVKKHTVERFLKTAADLEKR